MVNIPRWKVILIVIICALGVLYSAPNVMSEQGRVWLRESLPSWMPNKTVNLGLDLRGGAHLLYAVDVESVYKERAEALEGDIRKALREEKIGYSRLGTVKNGVRVTLRDPAQGEQARRILRGLETGLTVETGDVDGLISATFSDEKIKEISDQTLSQSIEIVRRRIDELGTTEPIIQKQGADRLLIQAPGADAQALKDIIGTTAKLTFHLVKTPGSAGAGQTLPMLEDAMQKIEVHRRAIITGDMLENAQPGFSQNSQPVVNIRFNGAGTRRFCDITRKNVNKPFAMVLDGEVISAPNINEPICGGQAQISGAFTVQEASDLALLLRAGALPAPMNVMEERTVGPSLGADSVEAGKIASLIGLAMVLVFMLLAYGTFGFYADIALMVNVALLFALLSSLQATLTLPGIAGIVLTIGMAVDANVLIFDRIREELAAGRSAISAVDAGYRHAMSTIVDSEFHNTYRGFNFVFIWYGAD